MQHHRRVTIFHFLFSLSFRPHLSGVIVYAAGNVVWRRWPGPAGAGAVTAYRTWGQTRPVQRVRLSALSVRFVFDIRVAILTHGMDADTSVTCVVFEGGEKGGAWAVHSFPNLCARPADNSLPEWLTTFVGTEKGGFRLTNELPTSWM